MDARMSLDALLFNAKIGKLRQKVEAEIERDIHSAYGVLIGEEDRSIASAVAGSEVGRQMVDAYMQAGSVDEVYRISELTGQEHDMMGIMIKDLMDREAFEAAEHVIQYCKDKGIGEIPMPE